MKIAISFPMILLNVIVGFGVGTSDIGNGLAYSIGAAAAGTTLLHAMATGARR